MVTLLPFSSSVVGANVQLADNYGRNFLHLIVLQPGGLKNITAEVLKVCHIVYVYTNGNYICNIFLYMLIYIYIYVCGCVPHQREDIKLLVRDEDVDGCTPLHYACRHGVPNSVNNLMGLNGSLYSKSKDKRSALHFAAW